MINNIQALRGLSSLLVFFHHSLGHFLAMGLSLSAFEWVGRYGFVGVDVFFVISGMVIAKSINQGLGGLPVSARDFAIKRFLRIFLGYLPMFVLAWVVHAFYHTERLEQVDFFGSLTLLNVRMESLLITPSWSLTFELFFYALVSVMLLAQVKKHVRVFVVYMTAIVLKINLFGYGHNLMLDFLFSPLVLEFFAGFLFWHFRENLLKKWSIVLWVGLACMGLTIGVQHEAYDGGMRVMGFGLFSLSVVALVVWSEGWLRLKESNWLVKLGDASYTLYLFHTIVLGWFFSVGLRDWLVSQNVAVLGFFGLIIGVCLLSYVLYRAIEKPLYLWVLKKVL